jgi:MutS domain V
VLVWAAWGVSSPLLAVLVSELAVTYLLRNRINAALSTVEGAYEALKNLSQLLERIEAERFAAAPLRALVEQLSSHAMSASRTLGKLATVANFVEARRNPFLAPLLLVLLYPLQTALAAERWRRAHGHAVQAWLNVVGSFEALLSLARYSYEHPQHPFAEFIEGAASFEAEQLGHPLIGRAQRVCNDVSIAGATRVWLVSGSNMSGKSTLLRSVGINTVLAMAGAPVCAQRMRLTPLQVGACIRVNDSLHEGSSRFYAEITRLRQLFDPYELPLLFLMDELLNGTNSVDRRIGAQGVIRALLARGAIGLVSTHDLALSSIVDAAQGSLANVHFQDEIRDGKLVFDFKLQPGVVTKSNGIELMRSIGLDV